MMHGMSWVPFAEIISVDLFGKRLEPGSGTAFIVLVSFLISWLAIRTSARMTRSVSWWPGGVESGGVHYHHLVWGILLMMFCGFLAFATPLVAPWWHLVAIGFGIGAGFTIDEFALWVRLEDVYWTEEGRSSFDAVVATVAFGLAVVLGTRPFGLDDPTSITVTAVSVAVIGSLAIVCFAKGRVVFGIIWIFIPLVALVIAFRLGRPTSPWAKSFYDDAKLARATHRYATDRPMVSAQRRVGDLIAGAPSNEE